jgi:L-lactate dehydrogenase complex protein LldG
MHLPIKTEQHMKVSPAKENILKKIRQALTNPVPVPFPQSEGTDSVFQPPMQEPELEFAENFTKLQGRFVFCAHETELAQQLALLVKTRGWTKLFCKEPAITETLQARGFQLPGTTSLHDCDAAVTGCEALIARTGSILLSSAQLSGRTTSVYAPVHICIAYTSQLVYDIKEGLQQLKEQYPSLPSLITLATGPSRTADIEKTLVVGVHGPREVFCFLVEQNGNQ